MKIIKLSKQILENRIDEFMALESYYSTNTSERWNISNLEIDLPKKWDYSFIGINKENKLEGYTIASLKDDKETGVPYSYIHRSLIHPDHNAFLFKALCYSGFNAMRKDDIQKVRWSCSIDNLKLYNFYLNFSDNVLEKTRSNGIEYVLFEKKL